MNPKAYLDSGNAYYLAKNFSQAILEYNRAIKMDQNCAEAYIRRGQAYYELDAYNAALEDFQKVKGLQNNNYIPHFYSGMVFFKHRNYDAALQAFTEVLNLSPNNLTAFNNRGMVYDSQHKFESAINDYTQAIQISEANGLSNKNKQIIFANRAQSYFKMNKFMKATDDFREVILLDSQFGKNKYYIVDKIKDLPNPIAVRLLKECIDPNTLLGAFIFEQMGTLKCSRYRGAAKVAYDALLKLNDKNQSSSFSFISFFKQTLGIKDNKEEPGIELKNSF